jgi:hypothetical protein
MLLDTVGVVRGADAVPEQVEQAVTVCIGYLDGHAWRPLRADELAALAPAERRDIAEYQLALPSARVRGVVRDRSRDGGHA